MFDRKKNRGIIIHDIEGWCKIWRKTGLSFGKWHEEYGKLSPEQFKVSKLGYWCDPLTQSRKTVTLKPTEELYVVTIKNEAKFEEELTSCFKIGLMNLIKFDPSTRKSQNVHFNGLLLRKLYIAWAKKELINNLSWNWRGIKNL